MPYFLQIGKSKRYCISQNDKTDTSKKVNLEKKENTTAQTVLSKIMHKLYSRRNEEQKEEQIKRRTIKSKIEIVSKLKEPANLYKVMMRDNIGKRDGEKRNNMSMLEKITIEAQKD